jgi:hypothetical protein
MAWGVGCIIADCGALPLGPLLNTRGVTSGIGGRADQSLQSAPLIPGWRRPGAGAGTRSSRRSRCRFAQEQPGRLTRRFAAVTLGVSLLSRSFRPLGLSVADDSFSSWVCRVCDLMPRVSLR